ncbi:MAG TPA: DM13 domain-containing protein [Candidatus Acidoferrum sp.]|nr:DM13 domain-containing protein [Candidatus Acidoferrum sp.]
MVAKVKVVFSLAALAAAFALPAAGRAQEGMKQDQMQGHKRMQDDKMTHEGMTKTLFTGRFHGQVHKTEGRATVYQEANGKPVLRLKDFKTSNGPDVHVVLVSANGGDAKSLKSDTERIELGKLKGNEGDQNYEIPVGTDLTKFDAILIYCERFNAVFGVAPLEKF